MQCTTSRMRVFRPGGNSCSKAVRCATNGRLNAWHLFGNTHPRRSFGGPNSEQEYHPLMTNRRVTHRKTFAGHLDVFASSGRVTAYPEVTPKKCGSVGIGDKPQVILGCRKQAESLIEVSISGWASYRDGGRMFPYDEFTGIVRLRETFLRTLHKYYSGTT
jgi:hypothetical protein